MRTTTSATMMAILMRRAPRPRANMPTLSIWPSGVFGFWRRPPSGSGVLTAPVYGGRWTTESSASDRARLGTFRPATASLATGEQAPTTSSVSPRGTTCPTPSPSSTIAPARRSRSRSPTACSRRRRCASSIRSLFIYDPAFMQTAACQSADHLPRRRRRHPALPRLPDRAARRAQSTYLEVAYLLLNGELPNAEQLDAVEARRHAPHVHPRERAQAVRGRASTTTPTRWACSCRPIAALGDLLPRRQGHRRPGAAATSRSCGSSPRCRRSRPCATASRVGLPFVYPDNTLSFPANFLNMMWKIGDVRGRPGARAGDGRAVHPPRRPRAELRHDRDARRRLEPRRPLLGRAPRRPPRSTARCTAAPTRQVVRMLTEIGSIENVPAFIDDGEGGQGPAAWASATASTRTTTRGPRSSRRPPYEVFEVTGKNPLLDIALEARRGRAHRRLLHQPQAVPERRLLLGPDLPGDGLPGRRCSRCCSPSPARPAGWRTGRSCSATRTRRSAGPRQWYTGAGVRDYVPIANR